MTARASLAMDLYPSFVSFAWTNTGLACVDEYRTCLCGRTPDLLVWTKLGPGVAEELAQHARQP